MPEGQDPAYAEGERLLVLAPGRADRHYWRDLWNYRELFVILAWRDVAVQYKQTVIGVAWAVIRPLLTMLVFTSVFGGLAALPSEGGEPYAVMVMAGMLPWFLFSTMLNNGSSSLVQNANLISKVYFPRLIVPVATALVALVDFAITLVLLGIMLLVFRVAPDARVLLLPLFVLLTIVAALGPTLIMAALNVRYRDFRFIVPFVVQFGLYVSPVGFSSSVIPEKWRLLYSLNPVVGVIDGFRWCLLGSDTPLNLASFAISLGVSIVLLWIGLAIFRGTEKTFADLV